MHFNQVADPYATYTSPKGRTFRTISIERVEGTEKYINRSYKSLWRVCIKYLDNDRMLWLYFDYSDVLTETRAFQLE